LIFSIEDLKAQGHARTGGAYVVKEVAAPPIVDGDVVVEISYERPASQIRNAEGAVLVSFGPVPITNAQVRLMYTDDGWVVRGYRVSEA
jgi:hypothetical protein